MRATLKIIVCHVWTTCSQDSGIGHEHNGSPLLLTAVDPFTQLRIVVVLTDAGDSQDTPGRERPFRPEEVSLVVAMKSEKKGDVKSDKGGRKLYFDKSGMPRSNMHLWWR